MKTLSLWAKHHPIQARWLIAINRILLGVIGFLAGLALAENGAAISKTTWLVSGGLFLTGYLFYPLVGKGIPRSRSFARQKTCDALLVASSFLFYMAAGNFLIYEPPATLARQQVQVQTTALAQAPPEKLFEKQRQTFKTWKKKFRNDLREIRRGARGLDAGTVVLLVLGTLAILYLIGGLTIAAACSLSCNGQEGFASLVLIVGCAITVGLPVLMWRGAIRRSKRKELLKQKEEENPEDELPPPSREIQVKNQNLKICLETEPGSTGAVSLSLQDSVLAENATLSSQPFCQEMQLKPGKINRLSIQSAPGTTTKIKVTIEDGMVKKRFWLTLPSDQPATVNFKIDD